MVIAQSQKDEGREENVDLFADIRNDWTELNVTQQMYSKPLTE